MNGKTPKQELELDDIQRLALRGYGDLPRACYYLVSNIDVTQIDNAKYYLQELLCNCVQCGNPKKNSNSKCTAAARKWKAAIAFTYPGLKKFSASEDEDMRMFEVAFREGMSGSDNHRRARILGDINENSSTNWSWGKDNEVDLLVIVYLPRELKQKRTPENKINKQDKAKDCSNVSELEDSEKDCSDVPELKDSEIEKYNKEKEEICRTVRNKLSGFIDKKNGYVKQISAELPEDEIEPFGFRDGISQPVIAGSRDGEGIVPEADLIKPGEFILGYENEANVMEAIPDIANIKDNQSWGKNGTYLVLRQLEQDVEAFKKSFEKYGKDAELMKAKVVGRWPGGAPLTLSPYNDDKSLAKENDFNFAKHDLYGYRCPLGAHIRRGNPRDSLVEEVRNKSAKSAQKRIRKHRILRRARVYKDSESKKEGLMFMAQNAHIEDQFEFTQRQWINKVDFAQVQWKKDPLTEAENKEDETEEDKKNRLEEDDPLVGPKESKLTIQDPYAPTTIELNQFVKVRGGAYFFLPGLKALRQIFRRSGE